MSEKLYLYSDSYTVNIIAHFVQEMRKEGSKRVCKYGPKKIYWDTSHFGVAALIF